MSQIELQPGFDFQKAGKKVLEIEREGLAQLDQYINQDFSLACEKIFSCAGKVVVMGMGKSGHIGRKMAATFASTGTSSFFVHPGEAAHGDLGMVTPHDIVIALSNSGESNEILALIPVLKRLHVPLICMTSRPESTMARAADVHLCVKCPKKLAHSALRRPPARPLRWLWEMPSRLRFLKPEALRQKISHSRIQGARSDVSYCCE